MQEVREDNNYDKKFLTFHLLKKNLRSKKKIKKRKYENM